MSVLTQHTPTLPTTACPSCGTHVPITFPSYNLSPTETQSRISELEAQVRLLNGKAAAAADKLADYEDEVRFLRAVHARKEQQSQQQKRQSRDLSNGSPSTTYNRPGSPPDSSDGNNNNNTGAPERPHAVTSRLSSFSAFFPGRRGGSASASLTVPPSPGFFPSSPNPPPFPSASSGAVSTPNLPLSPSPQQQHPHPPPPDPPEPSISETLRAEIENEKRLRRAAETSLHNAHKELEELTAQLFSQANEMVAAERRARAKLEERVAVLEKRDAEKRRRLERLERAVERIDRVKGLVGS